MFRQTPETPHLLANKGHSHGEQATGDSVTTLPLYLRPPCTSAICHWHHQNRESEFHFMGDSVAWNG